MVDLCCHKDRTHLVFGEYGICFESGSFTEVLRDKSCVCKALSARNGSFVITCGIAKIEWLFKVDRKIFAVKDEFALFDGERFWLCRTEDYFQSLWRVCGIEWLCKCHIDMACVTVLVLVCNDRIGHRDRQDLEQYFDLFWSAETCDSVSVQVRNRACGVELSPHARCDKRAVSCVEGDFKVPDVLRFVVKLCRKDCRRCSLGYAILGVKNEREACAWSGNRFAELQVEVVCSCCI